MGMSHRQHAHESSRLSGAHNTVHGTCTCTARPLARIRTTLRALFLCTDICRGRGLFGLVGSLQFTWRVIVCALSQVHTCGTALSSTCVD